MRARGILVAAATTLALAGGGCFAPPEACNECRAPGSDAATDGLGAAGHFGTGGTIGIGGSPGNGGAPGTGGTTGAGGSTGTGGMVVVGTGGSTMGTGGVVGTGGTVVVGTGGTMGTGGVVGTGGTVGTGGSGGTIDVALVAWYQMDETSGTTAADSSGHGRTAALMAMNGGTAAFSTTHKVGTGALNLTSTSADPRRLRHRAGQPADHGRDHRDHHRLLGQHEERADLGAGLRLRQQLHRRVHVPDDARGGDRAQCAALRDHDQR